MIATARPPETLPGFSKSRPLLTTESTINIRKS